MPQNRILVVEDCATDVELLLCAFREEGVTNPIAIAETARAALDQLAADPVLPAVMLLDSRLPDMPGVELLRLLRADARLAHTPVVMFTGLESPGDREHAGHIGANSFLPKPASFEALRQTVRALKSEWLDWSEKVGVHLMAPSHRPAQVLLG